MTRKIRKASFLLYVFSAGGVFSGDVRFQLPGAFDSGPSDKLGAEDSDQGSRAVDENISGGRTAARHHGLVILICGGKGHTDKAGQKKQPDSPHVIGIQRNGKGHCQDTVFGHMGQFAYRAVISFRVQIDLFLGEILVQDHGSHLYQLLADFIA